MRAVLSSHPVRCCASDSACWRKSLQLVKLLVSYDADIMGRNCRSQTPLHWACMSGDLACVAYLLQAGADPFARVRLSGQPRSSRTLMMMGLVHLIPCMDT